MQRAGVAGFSLEKKEPSGQLVPFAPQLSKHKWAKLQRDAFWHLAKRGKVDQSYTMLCEEYKEGEEESPNGCNKNEFKTYGPCPKCTGKDCPTCEKSGNVPFTQTHTFEGTEMFHSYIDIHNPQTGELACRVVNVHMPSACDTSVDIVKNFVVLAIEKHAKDHVNVPLFFGGDSNVYYGGGNGLDGIQKLQKALKELDNPYTLCISRNTVRKRRSHSFFYNAQAAIKCKLQIQETMFIAFPSTLESGQGQVVPNEDLDQEIVEKRTVVGAFTGAAYGETKWE